MSDTWQLYTFKINVNPIIEVTAQSLEEAQKLAISDFEASARWLQDQDAVLMNVREEWEA